MKRPRTRSRSLFFAALVVSGTCALSACGSCTESSSAEKDKGGSSSSGRPFNVQWEGGHRLHWGHHEGGAAGEGGPRRHRRDRNGGGTNDDEGGSPIE